MHKQTLTRYHVDQLVEARKFAMRPTVNTFLVGNDPNLVKRELKMPVRRVDSPNLDLVLVFDGRVKTKGLPGVRSMLLPSASLLWHGKRIRCIDHKITHSVIENGVEVGKIKGWHEHFWTDTDEDRSIRVPLPPLKNSDLASLVEWCSTNWKIEGVSLTSELFND